MKIYTSSFKYITLFVLIVLCKNSFASVGQIDSIPYNERKIDFLFGVNPFSPLSNYFGGIINSNYYLSGKQGPFVITSNLCIGYGRNKSNTISHGGYPSYMEENYSTAYFNLDLGLNFRTKSQKKDKFITLGIGLNGVGLKVKNGYEIEKHPHSAVMPNGKYAIYFETSERLYKNKTELVYTNFGAGLFNARLEFEGYGHYHASQKRALQNRTHYKIGISFNGFYIVMGIDRKAKDNGESK